MRLFAAIAVFVASPLFAAQPAAAQSRPRGDTVATPEEPAPAASQPTSSPTGRLVTLNCTADTLLLTAPQRGDTANCGGLRELQLQGNNAWALFRFDFAPVRDVRILRATLRVHRRQFHLVRASVSTVASTVDWAEGTATEPEQQVGAACFRDAAFAPHPSQVLPWARPGSTIAHVTFGYGGSRWAYASIRYERDLEWFSFEIPADLVQAMADGTQSSSLVLTDDFNRSEAFCSIDSRETLFPPTLLVEVGPAAREASEALFYALVERDKYGFEWLKFDAPEAFAFDVTLSDRALNGSNDPGAPGQPLDAARTSRIPLYGLPSPGQKIHQVLLSRERREMHRYAAVRVRAAGGEWSPYATAELPPPVRANPELTLPRLPRFDLPAGQDRCFTMDAGPSLSEDGRWIRNAAKTWWDPLKGPIALQAAWNEFASFQVVLAGGPAEYAVTLTDWKSPAAAEPAPQVSLFREHYVRSRLGEGKFCPDPLAPIEKGARLKLDLSAAARPAASASAPSGGGEDEILPSPVSGSQPAPSSTAPKPRARHVQPIWVDVYVPPGVARGLWRCRLIALRDGVAELDIPLELDVVRGELPNALSFPFVLRSPAQIGPGASSVPASGPARSEELLNQHRLAHAHRASLCPLPYTADGRVLPGLAPALEFQGKDLLLDWHGWDARFGGLLDGAAFRGLPRDSHPLARVATPVHENWPALFRAAHGGARTPLAQRYHFRATRTELVRGLRPNPRAEESLLWPLREELYAEYQSALSTALPPVVEHFTKWPQTRFDVWLANPPGRAELGGGWMLEQPETIDDVAALAFFLRAVGGPRLSPWARDALHTHVVLSDPLVTRDLLAGLADSVAMGAGLLRHHDAVLERPDLFPQLWTLLGQAEPEYGWAKVFSEGWSQRLAGAQGALVLVTPGEPKDWDKANSRTWLYPLTSSGGDEVVASGRLKAGRRFQEDMEWLAQVIARERARGVAEGYVLSFVGVQLAQANAARFAGEGRLLPVIEFPGRIDSVVFEELRRGLRAAAIR